MTGSAARGELILYRTEDRRAAIRLHLMRWTIWPFASDKSKQAAALKESLITAAQIAQAPIGNKGWQYCCSETGRPPLRSDQPTTVI